MNNDGYRINGGIGFSIANPTIKIFFDTSIEIEINDERENKLTNNESNKLKYLLEKIKHENNMKYGISCKIESVAFPHYGLGSGTIIYLSCVEALFLINNISYEKEKIVNLSKRGGTSGIGINTYFNGGFIFDVGIKRGNDSLIPDSIAERKGKLPLILKDIILPDWKIGICIPKFIKNKTEDEEKDFFNQSCPIKKSYILDILYESLYGITSSIIEKDYNVFCESINKIQKTRWKYLERNLYGKELFDLENMIYKSGADCVGMSSLGPTLFFFGDDIDKIINNLLNNNDIECFSTKLNNQSRKIIYA